MSKAEDRAYECFPNEDVESKKARFGFLLGYHQAEKDNELTWEDISKIISIDQHVCGAMGISNYTHNHQQAMEEVLKRFQDLKK